MNSKVFKDRAQRVEDAFRLLQGNKDNLGNIPGIIRRLVALRVWEGYDWKGKTVSFGTFREFVEAPPPEGLGTTIADLVRFCQKYPEVADLVDQTVQEQKPEYHPKKGNDRAVAKRSNGSGYQRSLRQLRILAQEDPRAMKLREQVLRGEITPNQALKDLGKRKSRYGVEASAESIVQFAKRHLSKSERKKVIKALDEE
jgi:hypothetical protein